MSENNHASSNGLWSKIGRFLPKYLYALGASFYLFTVGTFSRNHRFLIFLIAKHFRMRIKMEESRLPTTPLSSVIDTHVDLHLFELIGEGGNVSFLELMVIASMARRAIPLVAFEIGTFDGRTALNIAANLTPDGRVYTLDLPKTGLQETRFELVPGEIVFVDKEANSQEQRMPRGLRNFSETLQPSIFHSTKGKWALSSWTAPMRLNTCSRIVSQHYALQRRSNP
jgi:hypothetical protein